MRWDKFPFAFMILAVQSSYMVAETITSKPNIVLLLLDDVGFGDMGYSMKLNSLSGINYGKTPNIDAMAASPSTWVLNNMHSEAACSPSRISILTARSPLKDCVLGDTSARVGVPFNLQASTVVQLAKNAGYDTYFLGKFLGDVETLEQSPAQLGFTDWRVMQGGVTWDYTCSCKHEGSAQKWCFLGHYAKVKVLPATKCVSKVSPAGVTNFPATKTMDTDFLVAEFSQWLSQRQNSTRPYLVQVSFKSVHIPFVASPTLRKDCRLGKICNHAKSGLELDYGGCIASLDSAVGAIRRLVLQEANTILILISDNGPAPRTGLFPGAGNTGGLRGAKLTLFEGLLRVPSLFEWPAMITANRVSNSLLSIMDLPATLAHVIVGEDVFSQDGASFLPSILSDQTTFQRSKYLGVCSFTDDVQIASGVLCIQMALFDPTGRYKLVASRVRGTRSVDVTRAELYDLQSVKGEYANVVTQPALMAEMVQEANAWLNVTFQAYFTRCLI